MIIDASGCKVVRPKSQPGSGVLAAPPLKDSTYTANKPKDEKTGEVLVVEKEKEKRAEKDTMTATAKESQIGAKAPEASATCLPQGLTNPSYQREEKFTLGGMADSLYEYLIKVILIQARA